MPSPVLTDILACRARIRSLWDSVSGELQLDWSTRPRNFSFRVPLGRNFHLCVSTNTSGFEAMLFRDGAKNFAMGYSSEPKIIDPSDVIPEARRLRNAISRGDFVNFT